MVKIVTFAGKRGRHQALVAGVLLVGAALVGPAARAQEVQPVNFSLAGYAPDQVDLGFLESVIVPDTAYHVYVAPSGSDAGSGAQNDPYRSLTRAAAAVTRPGTTVHVAPGSYAGGFKTTANGSAASRIYWVSTVKWGAHIVPPASSVANMAWDNRGNYVSIIGFDIDGSVPKAGRAWTHGIYNGGSFVAIAENHVHHIATATGCSSAGGSAIGVDAYYHGVHTDVLSNLVHDIGPEGCRYVQGIYMSTSGTVKNNIVYRVAEAGIHLWHDASNVVIANNTVAASDTGIIVGGGDFYFKRDGNDHTNVYSNIIYDNRVGIAEQGKTGPNNSYRNNLVSQNKVNWSLKAGMENSATVTSVPQFVAYDRSGTPDFRPGTDSPAIGRGNSLYSHPTDFSGRARNDKTGYDIGAFQH